MSPKQFEAAENAKLVRLDQPRALSAAEQALLEFLIAPLDNEELTRQVERARVVGHCTCGCPSATLESDAPPVPGRDDSWEITAVGTDNYPGEVQVTLHVVSGEVFELEIWGADATGELVTDLPTTDALRPLEQ